MLHCEQTVSGRGLAGRTCSDALGGSEALAGIPVEHVEEGAHAASHSGRLRAGVMEGWRSAVGLCELIHHPHGAQRNDALPVECQVKRLPGEAEPPQNPRCGPRWSGFAAFEVRIRGSPTRRLPWSIILEEAE